MSMYGQEIILFYTGTQKIIDTEGRVDRFLRKYGMLDPNAEADSADSKK